MREQELLQSVIEKKKALTALKEQCTEAQKAYDSAETTLIEYMAANNATATARYDGLGYASIYKEPSVYASYDKEYEADVFQMLKEKGVGDIIKPTVNAKTLSSIVKEWISTGESIPELIRYYIKPRIKIQGE